MQKSTAFYWRCPQLAHRNCHNKRHPQHQNMDKPTLAMQTSQWNTLVHIVSILNITRYATQVNRHSINNLIDAVCTTSQDINNLYNLTTSLATSINFNQMILHIRSVFANLRDSLHYLQMVSTHIMDYIDDATSGILSPHVLPITDLQKMSNTLLTPYCQPCTYQFHQRTLSISTGTCILTSWLRTNSFYYWLTYPYKIEPARSQSTKPLLWISPTGIIQPTMTWAPNTLEPPKM